MLRGVLAEPRRAPIIESRPRYLTKVETLKLIRMRPSKKRAALPLAPAPRRISKFHYCCSLGPLMVTFPIEAGVKLFGCILKLLTCTRSSSGARLTGPSARTTPSMSERTTDLIKLPSLLRLNSGRRTGERSPRTRICSCNPLFMHPRSNTWSRHGVIDKKSPVFGPHGRTQWRNH